VLSAGQVVDRYEVQALLGQGGMAAVYRVRHTQLQVDRALKVLTIGHPGVRQRLLLEGRVQASLSHPNVVSVTDVLEVGGQPGLLMEYIEGPSLQQWLEAHRPSLDEALSLFRDIATGVGYAHQRDLIHRDLKPANVLILRRGQELVAKVADFGLAKVVADEMGDTGNTRTGIGMGTPSYMAPEQIRDAKRVDKRGDIFALGSILYELCTGQRAFGGDDILAQLAAVAAGDHVPPRQLAPDLPDAVVDVIEHCLQVDREDRMPSCDALLQALPVPAPFSWSEEALTVAVPPPEQALQKQDASGTWAPMTLAPTPSSGADGTWTPGGTVDPGGLAAPDGGPAAAAGPPTEDAAPASPHRGAHRSRNTALLVVAGAALLTVGGMWLNERLASGDARRQAAAQPVSPPASSEGPPAAQPPSLDADPAQAPGTDETAPDVAAGEPTDGDQAQADPVDAAGSAIDGSTATDTRAEEAAPSPPQPSTSAAASPASSTSTSTATPTSPSTSTGTDSPDAAEAADAEAPEAPPPETGHIRFLGDADSVTLKGAAGSFSPGDVPVGTYDVIATFPGRDPANAGQVTITAGAELLLRCRAAFVKCVP